MVLNVGGGNSRIFNELAQKGGGRLFLKPNSGSCGYGAFIADVSTDECVASVYNKLIKTQIDWMAEEVIEQAPEMAEWNKSSVNTIRIPAFNTAEGFFLLTPTFRTGRKGSVIDNAAAGGIIANIDLDTGIIYSNGVDERGHSFEKHPDSGIRYKGWAVPRWSELMSLVEEIHTKNMQNHLYIGWDFALTPQGWCVIEGNWGQMINQYVDRKGRKADFVRFMSYGK